MAKRKRQAQRQTGIQKTENFPANNMNEKMLTSIITNALLEYDKRKEQEAQENGSCMLVFISFIILYLHNCLEWRRLR